MLDISFFTSLFVNSHTNLHNTISSPFLYYRPKDLYTDPQRAPRLVPAVRWSFFRREVDFGSRLQEEQCYFSRQGQPGAKSYSEWRETEKNM